VKYPSSSTLKKFGESSKKSRHAAGPRAVMSVATRATNWRTASVSDVDEGAGALADTQAVIEAARSRTVIGTIRMVPLGSLRGWYRG
jgi:hypothetical protein